MLEAFSAKPKGMRRRTYDRLRRALDLAQGKAKMRVTQFVDRLHRQRGRALLEGAALAGVTPKSNLGRNNHMDAITFSPTLATARMLLELAERHASTREPQT